MSGCILSSLFLFVAGSCPLAEITHSYFRRSLPDQQLVPVATLHNSMMLVNITATVYTVTVHREGYQRQSEL